MLYRTSTRTIGATLVALVGLAACAEHPGPTAVLGDPSFDFLNTPDNGNPRIVRFGTTRFAWVIVDVENNLFSLQAGTDQQFDCHAADVFDVISVQRLLSNPDDPTARMMAVRLGQGAYVAVFRGPFPSANCADLMSRKIAEGTGQFVSTDNDLDPSLRDHHNYNAFGIATEGMLDRVDGGGRVHYNGVGKCVWDGADPATVKCVDRINLQ